jgi:hypothetical protein
MRLAALQSAFQDAVLNDGSAILPAILPSQRLSSAARLAIYADAYRSRLGECLASDYPILRIIMGDEDFGLVAAAYIDATPSSHRNARWYGHGLPHFLSLQWPWCDTRVFADLASLERALADAFDAADAPCLGAESLADFASEEQPRLRLTFAPSVGLLNLAAGTGAAYAAAVEDLPAEQPDESREESILIWRGPALEPLYRTLAEDEALTLAAATSGATLDEICGLLSLRHNAEAAAEKAALLLAHWFQDGLVTDLSRR